MNKCLPFALALVAIGIIGCESKPKVAPPPPSQPLDAAALESLRSSLGSDVVLAGVSRVLSDADFLALEAANTEQFPVGTPVSVIDSNRNTLAHGWVVTIVHGEVHIQFTVTGPRRPEIGDAVIAFPRH
jgi:hypothetical protein